MKDIVLIGMPTAGKSTVGVIVAKAKGYQFIDSDLVIQEQSGKLLHEMIEEQGIDGFIRVEEQVNSSLNPDHAVIATGGSVIYGEKAMKHLKEIGTVVYIKVSYQEVCNRLKNAHLRGVVLRENQSLLDLYEERCPLYEKYADLVVDGERLDIEELVDQIMNKLENYEGSGINSKHSTNI